MSGLKAKMIPQPEILNPKTTINNPIMNFEFEEVSLITISILLIGKLFWNNLLVSNIDSLTSKSAIFLNSNLCFPAFSISN